jgi:hypothetical protein
MPISLPMRSKSTVPSRYSPLGLRNLPFPLNPVLNPYSSDERINGTIYAESVAGDAIEKFERLLICPDDFPNRARLAVIVQVGRSLRVRA